MFLAGGADGDFDVLAQGGEEFHEASDGEVTGAVAHHQGDLRLLHAENLGRLDLGHASALALPWVTRAQPDKTALSG